MGPQTTVSGPFAFVFGCCLGIMQIKLVKFLGPGFHSSVGGVLA